MPNKDLESTVTGVRTTVIDNGPYLPLKVTSDNFVKQVTSFTSASVNGNRITDNPYSFTKRIGGNVWGTDYRAWQSTAYNPATGVYTPYLHTETVTGYLTSASSATLADEKNAAYNDALNDLSEMVRGGIDFSIDVGQGKQTLDMLGSIAPSNIRRGLGQLGHALNNIDKGVSATAAMSRRARALIKGGSQARLAYVYGWKPFMEEIWNALDTLVPKPDSEEILRFKARASKSQSKTFVTRDVPGDGARSYYTRSEERTDRVELVVRLKPGNSVIQAVSGYTSLNPVSIAYELIPGSFIADWFFDIGGYLRNLETGMIFGNRFIGGYRTDTSRHRWVDTQTTNGTNTSGVTFLRYGTATNEVRTKTRSVLTDYPLPVRPVLSCNLGSGRLLNAAALLGGLLK